MKGMAVCYRNLGQLLKQGRERKGLSPSEVTMILGVTNSQYLWRCENGRSNFPVKKLKRALDLYGIPPSDAIVAAASDFTESMTNFLAGKKK